jgi:predicted ArsR family transcriptional regulator
VSGPALLEPDRGPSLGQSRARVLDLLRAAGSSLGAQDVADGTGLHANTARFHLEALVRAGLAVRAPKPRATPGRPSTAYRAVEGGTPAGGRRYRLLAEMLTSLIAGVMPEPGEAAAEAGREWGRYLTDQPAPYLRLDAAKALGRLAAMMEQTGFSPQVTFGGTRHELRLRHCPFREIAEEHQDIICRLHLGLLQGALAQMRAPLTADRLEPFAEPSLCIAHLTELQGPGQSAQRRDRASAELTPGNHRV